MTKQEAVKILKMYYPIAVGDPIPPLFGQALVELDYQPGAGHIAAEINQFVEKFIILR